MNIYYDSLVFLAFFSLALCILAWLLKSPLRSFIMQVSEFWRKAGWMTRAGALTVFFALWIYASVKPTNQTQSASTPLSQQIELIMSGTASTQSGINLIPPETVTSNTVPELTAAQAAAGFCILSVETNQNPAVCWSTNDLPSGTAVHVQDDWLATGRYNDGFWLNTTNLDPLCAFRLNSQDVTNIYISTSGTVSFGVPKGAEAAQPMPTSSGISFLSPLWGPLGIKPGLGGSSVWVASTTNHNILVTWEDILIDRIDSSNTVGSIQCELCNNGDFIYRYSVSSGLTISNHVVGAQNNGFGESADLLNSTNSALCVNAFEVKWAGYFQSYEMDESGDTDGDGLLDKEEVRIHGTYPAREDSDGDLWSDSYEITNGVFATDPLNPDSDGDTIIDSLDSDPLTWEDVTAINTNDGYTTQYHADNGLPHAYDLSTDSDNDGVPDWIELLCGSSETNAGSRCYSGEDYFEVTITLAADLPAPVILRIGPRTLCLRYAGTRSLIFAAGQAHAVTLLACERCLVNLGISFSTGKAVLLNPSAVFSGGAVLPAGAEQAGGTVVLPRINIDPGLICFHSSNSKAATGTPVPDINGTYSWYWFEEAGEGITLTGKTVNISWQGGGSSRSLNLAFRPDGATEDIYGHKTVYRCTLAEDNPGGDVADWIDPDSPPEPPCAWPQSPEETEDNPSTNNAAGPGEPYYAARYGIAIAVNNDDDDADGKLDNESTEDGVTGDDDLYASYLYTPFEGECCPCPAHNPAVSSVSIEYLSPKLRLWDNAEKTTVSTGVNAGQMQYLEGVSPSTSVTGESLILSWTEDDEYKAKTNNYTVFSLRMFGDYNLDGTINSNDYAAASDISDNGWVMPVASNTLRRLELKNDVLIPGNMILSLSGSDGIRIWDTPTPASTNTPLLVSGQTITNGVDGTNFGEYPEGMLYVEAIDAGTARLNYSYVGTGAASEYGCSASVGITAVGIDIDVDSDNDDGIGSPERTVSEDLIEDKTGDATFPGKLIHVNDDDTDNDFIPDYADGFDRDGASASDDELKDDSVAGENFVPVVISLPALIDISSARIEFSYSDSSPSEVSLSGLVPELEYAPGSGEMRVWTCDGDENRNGNSVTDSTPGNYVPADLYEVYQLGYSDTERTKTFYIEGVNASSSVAGSWITVRLDPDGDGPLDYQYVDSVRITVLKVDLSAEPNSNECTEETPGTPVLFNDDWDGENIFGANPPTGHYEKEPIWDYQYTDGEISGEDDLMRVLISVAPSNLTGNVILKIPSGSLNLALWPRSTKGTAGELISVSGEGKTYSISSLPADFHVEGLAVGSANMTLDYTFGEAEFTDILNIDIISLEENQGGIRKIIYEYGDSGDPLLFQVKPSTLSDKYTYLWDLDGDGSRNGGDWESSDLRLTTVKYSSAANGAGNVQLPQTAANRRKVYDCSVKLKGGDLKGGLVVNKSVRVALGTYQGTEPVSDPSLRVVEVNGLTASPTGFGDTELPNSTSTIFSQAWFENTPVTFEYSFNLQQTVNYFRLQYSQIDNAYGASAESGIGTNRKVYVSCVNKYAYDSGLKLEDLSSIAQHECRHAEQSISCATGTGVFYVLNIYFDNIGTTVIYKNCIEADSYCVNLNSNGSWLYIKTRLSNFYNNYEGARNYIVQVNNATAKSAMITHLQDVYQRLPFIEMKRSSYYLSVQAPSE